MGERQRGRLKWWSDRESGWKTLVAGLVGYAILGLLIRAPLSLVEWWDSDDRLDLAWLLTAYLYWGRAMSVLLVVASVVALVGLPTYPRATTPWPDEE